MHAIKKFLRLDRTAWAIFKTIWVYLSIWIGSSQLLVIGLGEVNRGNESIVGLYFTGLFSLVIILYSFFGVLVSGITALPAMILIWAVTMRVFPKLINDEAVCRTVCAMPCLAMWLYSDLISKSALQGTVGSTGIPEDYYIVLSSAPLAVVVVLVVAIRNRQMLQNI